MLNQTLLGILSIILPIAAPIMGAGFYKWIDMVDSYKHPLQALSRFFAWMVALTVLIVIEIVALQSGALPITPGVGAVVVFFLGLPLCVVFCSINAFSS